MQGSPPPHHADQLDKTEAFVVVPPLNASMLASIHGTIPG
jgi:hypothetical protein